MAGHWLERQVVATNELLKVKADLKILEARLAIQMRDDPTRFGMAKTTEAGIEQRVAVQPEVVTLQAKVLEADAELRAIRAVLDSIELKRQALRSVQELVMRNYSTSDNADGRQPLSF